MRYLGLLLCFGLLLGLTINIYAGADEPHWADTVKQMYPYWRSHYWVDRDLWGNQGYIIGQPPARLAGDLGSGAFDVNAVVIKEDDLEIDLQDLGEKVAEHVVKKGECLWYIAGYEDIYGNPLKWPMIYKANKDRIRDPDLIYPGQVFAIPRD